MAARKNTVVAEPEIQTPSQLEEKAQDEAVGYGNLDIWDNLSHTDPSATKGFSRQGGFKGTAIKPIWQEKMMTSTFGPVGIGWGMTKPDYEHVVVGEEVLVYCTIGVWYKWRGEKSDLFWGEGGDAMVKKRKDGGVQIDDEARKKSLTDALGNAFKRLGMAGDIHMGLWEDSKYQSANINYWFNKEVENLEHELVRKLPGVASIEALNAMKRTYGARIKEIRHEDEDAYERLVAPFAKREKELTARPAETLERSEAQPQHPQIEHEPEPPAPPAEEVKVEAPAQAPVQPLSEVPAEAPAAQAEQDLPEDPEAEKDVQNDEAFLKDLRAKIEGRIAGIPTVDALNDAYWEFKSDLTEAIAINKVEGGKLVDLFGSHKKKIENGQVDPSVTAPQAPPLSALQSMRTGTPMPPGVEDGGLRNDQVIDPNNYMREDQPGVKNWPEWRKHAINTVRRITTQSALDQWVERHAEWLREVSRFTTIGQYANGTDMTGDNVVTDVNLWVHRQRSILAGTNMTLRYGPGNSPSELISYFADAGDWANGLITLANSETGWSNVRYNVDQAKELIERHKDEGVAKAISDAIDIYDKREALALKARESA